MVRQDWKNQSKVVWPFFLRELLLGLIVLPNSAVIFFLQMLLLRSTGKIAKVFKECDAKS